MFDIEVVYNNISYYFDFCFLRLDIWYSFIELNNNFWFRICLVIVKY